jgi:hypothetical protein
LVVGFQINACSRPSHVIIFYSVIRFQIDGYK